jgi:ABC-2 type transport system permease protein
MATAKPGRNQKQQQAMIRIVLMAAILVCLNVLASYFHSGLDLTHEKRFTLSPVTKKLLKNMQEVAVVDVYLKGKFPAGMQRLQESVREHLRSFQDIAGGKIIVHFIDPLEGKTQAEQTQIVHDLGVRGVRIMQLTQQTDEEYSMKPFFPYAVVQYNGKEEAVALMEDPPGKSSEEKISYAEALLEYKFAAAINELGQPVRKRIAYITGNGEPLGIRTFDMLASLSRYYDLDTVDLGASLHISLAYDAVIVYQPNVPFTGPQKLKIDQYVMHGGHILFAVSNLQASLDSLVHSPQFIAMEYGLNLDDLLYKYGVRINNDLLEDMQCLQLSPAVQGTVQSGRDWVFFPRLNPTSEHPVVRNMDFIRGGFTNTMDTIRSNGINKTILLQSSKYSRNAGSPARVSLSIMNYPMKEAMFPKSYLPVAVLMEGKFRSVYQNLLAPEYLRLLDSLHEPFKQACDSDNRIIVTSVGDIFTNDFTDKDGPSPMGYYKWTGEFFANRNFLLNCMEYLTDRSGILEARSKEVKLRLLDSGRMREEKTQWQVVNVAIPIMLVLVSSSCYFFFRKRRYEVKKTEQKT